MAEDYYLYSPYHFSGNNPIKFVDLNGMNYDEWELTLKNDGTKDLKWLNDKGGNETQYVNVKWETSNGELKDLGKETWNWPNSELAMADIVSNGEAALGPWNESWWANASGRTEFSPVDPVDFVVGAAAAKWAIGGATAAKTGTSVVYQGFDKAGIARYVGITEREAAVRFGEHIGSGTAKSLLRYEVVPGATNLSRTGARVWEQTLINQYGLQKNGGLLLNKINSIAPTNWWQYGIK